MRQLGGIIRRMGGNSRVEVILEMLEDVTIMEEEGALKRIWTSPDLPIDPQAIDPIDQEKIIRIAIITTNLHLPLQFPTNRKETFLAQLLLDASSAYGVEIPMLDIIADLWRDLYPADRPDGDRDCSEGREDF